MEKYALLIYQSDGIVWSRPEAERERIISACLAHSATLAEQGVFIDGAPLAPAGWARTARPSLDEPLLVDGPFAETKEQLAGFYLISCADRTEAVRVAEEIIRVQENTEGGIEIRTVLEADGSFRTSSSPVLTLYPPVDRSTAFTRPPQAQAFLRLDSAAKVFNVRVENDRAVVRLGRVVGAGEAPEALLTLSAGDSTQAEAAAWRLAVACDAAVEVRSVLEVPGCSQTTS